MGSLQQILSNLSLLNFNALSVADPDYQIASAISPIIDNTITEINNTESTITNILISQYGGLKSAYYAANALAFQYGYNLSVNNAINPATGAPYLNLIYTTIDTTAQVVKQAAFQQVRSGNSIQMFLKIAGVDSTTNLLQPLSDVQFASFSSYMNNFEAPGLPLNLVNLPGNILNFNATATYSAAYDLSTIQTNIAAALVAFQTVNAPSNFQTPFQFNGEFYTGQLQDYVVSTVPGMIDFYIYNTSLDNTPFAGSTDLSSGYFNYFTNIINNINYSPINS